MDGMAKEFDTIIKRDQSHCVKVHISPVVGKRYWLDQIDQEEYPHDMIQEAGTAINLIVCLDLLLKSWWCFCFGLQIVPSIQRHLV
jgi:hypothetical protein